MATVSKSTVYATNYLQSSSKNRDFVTGKQPSEFTTLRESGRRLLPEGLVHPKADTKTYSDTKSGSMEFQKPASVPYCK